MQTKHPVSQVFLRAMSNAAFPSTNTQIGPKEVGTVPTLVVLKECFCGGGVVCGAVSGSSANTANPASEWPFLPNCLIVLVGQAGGSKPHLASGEKEKKINTHI